MSYEALAEQVKSFPHVSRFELRCHPNVKEALRALAPEEAGGSWWLNLPDWLTSIAVIERDDATPGSWWLYKDGRPVAWGDITDGLMFTLKEEDPRAPD